ncbi:MAG: response regulator [Deltaproteobacteria bacterium]|nr:MAG: response regulator [Deltaproteobacteria bacterium]
MTTVAIVDDDIEFREALADAFESSGFRVRCAANGLRLVSALQVDRPDVIVLDVMMSWIDGFELCRALKRNPEFRDIPVVFVSGRTSDADRQRGLACGAVDYFPKPVELSALVDRVRRIAEERAA